VFVSTRKITLRGLQCRCTVSRIPEYGNRLPQTDSGNTAHHAVRPDQETGDRGQNLSDNESENGSDTGSISKHDQSEAQKAFRHVLKAPNPEKFAGDTDSYNLWKVTLQDETEHIEMSPNMWIRLLTARTTRDALSIVQQCRKMQELVGPEKTVQNIWRIFDARFTIDRNPGQDLLNELTSGPVISESDSKTFWQFVDKCKLALDATETSETFRYNLAAPYTQELIAKRLGTTGFKEWSWHRQGRQMENEEVTFHTFCTWIERKARTLTVCKRNEPVQRNQSQESINQQSQYKVPQIQRQRGTYIRYQSPNRNRSQSTPGAKVKSANPCEICMLDTREMCDPNAVIHLVEDCSTIAKATASEQWSLMELAGVCFLCLNERHPFSKCPEFRGELSRCKKCRISHHKSIRCRPSNPPNQQKEAETVFLTMGQNHRYSYRTPQRRNRNQKSTVYTRTYQNSSNSF